MRIKLSELLDMVKEAKVGASADYMKKELVREKLQQVIAAMVASGEVADQKQLDDAIAALDMSVKALKMIPFEVWSKMAGGKSKKPGK